MTLLTRALQAGHVEVVRELLARSTSVVCGLLTTDADSRIAQVNAVPTDKNQEAFAMVREATLRADTQLANMNTKSAPAPSSESGDTQYNLPPPEVARMIPCKFFPNCRYGDRCLFRHPQGPVMAESMPPAGQPVFFPGPFPPAPAHSQKVSGQAAAYRRTAPCEQRQPPVLCLFRALGVPLRQ